MSYDEVPEIQLVMMRFQRYRVSYDKVLEIQSELE